MIKRKRTKRSWIWLMPERDFLDIANTCSTLAEFAVKLKAVSSLGRSGKTIPSAYYAIKDRSKELGILEKFENNKYRKSNIFLKPLETLQRRGTFKLRLIRDSLLPYVCCECGNKGEWNGKPLVLQIHHLNGKNSEHSLSNTVFICPNCHSQTDSFAGKNKSIGDTHLGEAARL
jgi:hypothetical protein